MSRGKRPDDGNPGIDVGIDLRSIGDPKPPAGNPGDVPEYQKQFEGCLFATVRRLLVAIAIFSALVGFSGVFGGDRRGGAAATTDPAVPGAFICMTTALVGLAVCYRPAR